MNGTGPLTASPTEGSSTTTAPPATAPPAPSKRDWYLIAEIVVSAVLLYFTLFPLLCYFGVFPKELIGGQFGVTLGMAIGIPATAISALIALLRWKYPIPLRNS
jgi:hypothetical protein